MSKKKKPFVLQVEYRAPGDLVPYTNNPKTHPQQQVDKIAGSIGEFDFDQPIVVDGDGVIIKGHGRREAALRLGIKKVPVIVRDDLTPAQVKAARLADNKVGESAWDNEALKLEIEVLKELEYDLDLTGFGADEIDLLLEPEVTGGREGLTDPDEVPEVPEKAVTTTGDLWSLGNHRILCGDSTNHEDIERLMEGRKAVLFATDPPYLVGYTGNDRPHGNKKWSDTYCVDGKDLDVGLIERFIEAAVNIAIDPAAAWYCWHPSKNQSLFEAAWQKFGAFVHQQIIWVKNNPVLTFSHYLWQHEPCFYGWIRGNKPFWKVQEHNRTVWQINTESVSQNVGHPTPKPVDCFGIPMLNNTKPGELCYEPFSGSGSQIIAGEKFGRAVFAMEIQPLYVDVAIRRWQNFAGLEAVLETDGRTFGEMEKARL